MSKQRKFIYSLLLAINDVLMLIASLGAAIKIRRDYWPIPNRPILAADYYSISYIVISIFLLVYALLDLYKNQTEKLYYKDTVRIIAANLTAAFILMSLSFAFKAGWLLSRSALLIFVAMNVLLTILGRNMLDKWIFFRYSRLFGSRNILIIGSGNLGFEFLQKLSKYKDWGFNVLGFLDTDEEMPAYSEVVPAAEECCAAAGVSGSVEHASRSMQKIRSALGAFEINRIGRIEDLEDINRKHRIDEVIIALPYEKYHYMKQIIGLCDKEGMRIRIIPGYYEYLQVSTRVDNLDGLPILNIREVPLDLFVNKAVKRIFDILLSVTGILFFAPLMLAVAAAVKLSSPGPVLYKQERVGVNNRKFMMLKFRSMRIQASDEEKAQWTTANDPRKTKVGSFIRKTSLDELPQLFNVLKGDMSIVGPRPERPYWVDKFKKEIPDYMLRHYIKSGITGWAQVNGWRGDTSIEERIKCDNYYIYNWSLWLDVKIVFLTVFKGFVNKNAY